MAKRKLRRHGKDVNEDALSVNMREVVPSDVNEAALCGIIPIIYGVSEKEINDMIKKYKKDYPNDERTKKQLRPFAVNQIIINRRNEKSKKNS